jgi:hypothetical protein
MGKKFDIEQLGSMCGEGLIFYNKHETFESAWAACKRGDWMLHIAAKLKIDKRTLTLAKGYCANTVRHLMMDDRSIKSVDTAIAFGEGRATDNKLNAAFIAAYSAAWDSDFAWAYASAYAAASASASFAAASATWAAAAAYSNNSKSARKENQKLTADICRKYLTKSVLEKIKEYDCENL